MGWQTTFKLDNEPLPVATSVRTWAQGEGERIAWSLAHGFLLPEYMHFFSGGTDGSFATWLQWHTIVVIHLFLFPCNNVLALFPFFMYIIIIL